ncbi:MAG: hypothetical protein AAB019_04650, partial [Planctomycetota bacterium]
FHWVWLEAIPRMIRDDPLRFMNRNEPFALDFGLSPFLTFLSIWDDNVSADTVPAFFFCYLVIDALLVFLMLWRFKKIPWLK